MIKIIMLTSYLLSYYELLCPLAATEWFPILGEALKLAYSLYVVSVIVALCSS